MNKLSLLTIIALSTIATGTLGYAAGTSPVYSVPELSTMIDSLTLRVSTLETQLALDEATEQQDKNTLEFEIYDLREYVIPDYAKSPKIIFFNGIHTSEQYRELISIDFTVQAFHDGGQTDIACLYQGQTSASVMTVNHLLGLKEYNLLCGFSIGSEGDIIVKFKGEINRQYTISMSD